jgi:hypothetical protein
MHPLLNPKVEVISDTSNRLRCIVPIRGVTINASDLEALWDRFFTAAPPR